MTYFFIFVLIQRHKRRHFKSLTSSCPDKGTFHEIDNVYQATCSNAVNIRGNFYTMPLGDITINNVFISNEPVHEISNNVVCATSKASDQPAHTRSLIRAFASRLSIL